VEALNLTAGVLLRGVGVITSGVPASNGPDDEALRARIVRGLERFGAGPAAYFRDACILMEGDPPVASDAHLVSHLLHELEGSVRAVLLPPEACRPPQEAGRPPQEAHRLAPEQAATQGAVAHGRTAAVRRALAQLVGALKALIQAVFPPPGAGTQRPAEAGTSLPAEAGTQRSAEAGTPLPAEAGTQRPGVTAISGSEEHRAEIRAVLDSLGISYDSDAGKTWLGYASLQHTRAHERGLGVPRAVEQEFRRQFADLEAMLHVVICRYEARYLALLDRLDALARVERPTDEHVRELRQAFPQDPVTMERFFAQLTSPAWIGPLRKLEFFAEPPAPVGGGEGHGWLPHWPALRYLVRVAGRDPALAVEVAMNIPATVNQLVNVEFVNLALEIPATQGVRLLPRIIRDLSGQYEAVRAERFGALLVRLVESTDNTDSGDTRDSRGRDSGDTRDSRGSGDTRDSRDGGTVSAALDLARALWGFASFPGDQGIPGAASELRTNIDLDSYAETLRTCLPPLVAAGGLDVLEAMAGLLDDAITRTSSPEMIKSRQDLSTLWRPAIAGQPLDTNTDAKTALVSAVRDTAGQLVRDRHAGFSDVLLRLDSRDWPIFRRLALCLVRQFGAGYPEVVARRLMDPAAVKDPFVEREFLLLAGDYFASLPVGKQQRVLSLIDQGPDVGAWAARYAAQAGRDPSGDQIQQWVAAWTRDRLAVLEPALPQQRRDSYRKLVRLVGEPVPAERTRATGRFMRDLARPPRATGLAGWSIDRLIEFLRTRQVADGPAGTSTYNVAQELGSAVRSAPLRYSAAADRFAGVPEPYVVQVLGGLHAAFENGADLDWTSILRLGEWMSGHETSVAGRPIAGEPEWVSGRREMITLLRAGLDDAPPVVAIAERDRVWHIIDWTLSRNAPAADNGPFGAGQALASARANALAAVISYGGWVRRHDRDADLADVFSVLDRHLDPDAEPSLLVRAVYGRAFHRLAHLDRSWAASAASRVFPADDADLELWDAAWGAYLETVAPIGPDVCELLNDQYRLAVDRLGMSSGESAARRDARLGHHLISRYWSGEITFDSGDQFIDHFYQRVSTAVHEQMTQYIGWNLLKPELDTDQAVLLRLSRLWDKRLAAASPSADRGELVRFGEWFASGRFDDDWSLRQLARVITLTGDVKPDILVLRRLAEIVPARTQLCLDIVNDWIKRLPDGTWLLSAREEYLRRILQVGLASPDASTSALAREIVNRAARRGQLRLQNSHTC